MAKVTLKDVTTATFRTLSNPPDGSAAPPEASTLCLKDLTTCKADVKDRVTEKPFYARNTDWNPQTLPNITAPISWPFLKKTMFKKSAIAKWDVLDLDFVAAPSADYTVRIYSATYGRANVPPQFIGVAYPTKLDTSKPPPFLVHYKHVPGQAAGTPLFKHFNPLGYDWLRYELWSYLVYNAGLTPGTPFVLDMPFVSSQQSSFGFTYQLRQAKKDYVVVLPQISRVFDPATKKLQDYQLYSASMLREVLVAIQKDILPIKDNDLSHVAISANSSGCNVVTTFLMDNMAAMKHDKTVAEFMNNEFNELFVLGPPENFGDAMVSSLAGWRALKSTRSSSKGKCVRFYTHTFTKKFADLTDSGKAPFTKGAHGLFESASKATSLAYLPFDKANTDDVWQLTYDESQPQGTMTVSNFAFVHHVIPALCLTHAASSSLYV